MKKFLRFLLLVAVIAFIAMQFIHRPDFTNPPVDEQQTIEAVTDMPPDVRVMLGRSCYDCHSHQTRWPWYSRVAPVSWLVAEDVEHGREELNFSTFATYSTKRQVRKLEEICDEVKKGKMPLGNYLVIHPDAKLSDADRRRLCEWTDDLRAYDR